MHRRIIYLVNPIAGTARKHILKEKIKKQTRAKGIEFEIVDTKADGDYTSLRNKITAESITDIIICGGDGSVNAVASQLLGVDINIGIIPMGSGNGLAYTAGIPKNIDKALKIIMRGKASFIDGFYINNIFSCMLCGVGFDAKVAHDFARNGKRGLFNYVKVTAANFFSARPYRFEVFAGDKSIETEAYFISIANSNQFGNYFTIAPKASLHDGLLDIVIVKRMNKLRLISAVLNQVRGLNVKQDFIDSPGKSNILYFQTSSLSIINQDNAPLHIDGDPRQSDAEFQIKVLPAAIRLIQP
jgi:YegS/Rv2252/BmrU family lipid kinase